MKKSIMRATLPDASGVPLTKLRDPLKKAGFEGIQLGVHGVGELTLRTEDADATKLGKTCRDAGIEPHSIYGGIRFFREDAEDRKRGIDEAKKTLDLAAAIGVKTVLLHPRHLSTSIPYDDGWTLSLHNLKALNAKAESN